MSIDAISSQRSTSLLDTIVEKLPTSYCYEVEQQRMELQDRLFFFKGKLKQLKCKALLYESILGGLDGSYDDSIPSEIVLNRLNEEYEQIVHSKNEIRNANLQIISDIETEISKILIYHQKLREELGFSEDIKFEKLELEAGSMALQFEARLREQMEYRNFLCKNSGFSLQFLSDNSARFLFHHVEDYSLVIEWEDGKCPKLKKVVIEPEVFIDDIVGFAIEDNSLSFLFREVSHRIHSISQRQEILKTLTQNERIRVEENEGQVLSISITCDGQASESKTHNFLINVYVPLEICVPLRIKEVKCYQGESSEVVEAITSKLRNMKNITLQQFADCLINWNF